MTLAKTATIDAVTQQETGKLTMVIVDAGTARDDEDRYQQLLAKLRTYLGFAVSQSFRDNNPGMRLADVTVRVVCAVPPTDKMRQIVFVGPKGDRVNRMRVRFEHLRTN